MGLGGGVVYASFPPPVWGYFAIFSGGLLLVRSSFPRIFLKHIEKQPIAGISAKDIESSRTWLIAVLLVISLATVGWKIHMLQPQPISLACQVEGVPVATVPSSSRVVLVDPYFPMGSINRWLIASARGYPPDYSAPGKLIDRCELTNLTALTLQDVSLKVEVLSIAASGSPSQGSASCDGQNIKYRKQVKIPVGDLPVGRTFVFFHYNGTDNCTQLRWGTATSSQFRIHLKMDTETGQLNGLGPSVFR
jgi:hypothetical protein